MKMEHIAPLVQTILWVALIGAIVWRFHSPIHGILVALQRRIETGSSIKAGPFELIDQLKPQEPEKQKLKLELEQAEVDAISYGLEAIADSAPSKTENTRRLERNNRLALAFQAEDLALRALQSEYGSPIRRQVTGGADSGFDGAFSSGDRTNIVEVKFIAKNNLFKRTKELRMSLERISNAIQTYQWPNPHLILAVVFESEEEASRSDAGLLEAVQGSSIPVTIRPFYIGELQRRFGLGAGDA